MHRFVAAALCAVGSLPAAAQEAEIVVRASSTRVDTRSGAATVRVSVLARGEFGIGVFDLAASAANSLTSGTFGFSNIAYSFADFGSVPTAQVIVNPRTPRITTTAGGPNAIGAGTFNFLLGGLTGLPIDPWIYAPNVLGELFSFDVTVAQGSIGTLALQIADANEVPVLNQQLVSYFVPTPDLFPEFRAYSSITITTDTITLVPAPSALAALGMAGLIAGRRRRG